MISKLPNDFDYQHYIRLNPDLFHFNRKEAEKHYLKFGCFEGRRYHESSPQKEVDNNPLKIPKDFNWETYIQINSDLHNMNKRQAIKHYLRFGRKENRKYKFEDSINNKVSSIAKTCGEKHPIVKKKNRLKNKKLPDDFNWRIYLQINKFPRKKNKSQAESHYLNHGKKENRKYRYPGKTYTIGDRIFMRPVFTPLEKTWCQDYNEVINKYGKIVICFISQGGGKYELMSKILALSIRSYNPQIDIIVGLPTPFNIYSKISEDTLSLFKDLNIKCIEITNQVSHNYKIANKYALIEKISATHNEYQYILFLDTDIICTNKFMPTKEMLNSDLSAITTDYSDWVNKTHKKKFEKSFWFLIHKICDVSYDPEKYNPPHLSCVTKKPIYADYFNAGYIFIKNKLIIPQTLNTMTKIIYNFLDRRPNTPSFTSDQIAIAVTSSKLNLKTHVIDMEHVYSCIPKHYPQQIINRQQFFHYHKPKCLRSIFVNFDWRQFNLNYKGMYRKGDNLLFNNQTHHQIVNSMLNDWKYLFRVKEADLDTVNSNFEGLTIYLKKFLLKSKEFSWSDNIETKSIFQVVDYLKNEPINNPHNCYTKYLLNEMNMDTTSKFSLYDLLTK